MAARVFSPKHDQHTRDKIQTSQLVNRLNSFALDTSETVRMTSDQVRAALGLLKKTIPDLAVTSHVGPTGGAVLIVTGVERDIADTQSSEPISEFPERGFKG